MKQVLIFKNDIIKYPPIISIVNILAERGDNLLIVGYCSDKNTIGYWKSREISYVEAITESVHVPKIKKMLLFKRFESIVKNIVESRCSRDDQLWLFGTETIYILNRLVSRYKCILYFFELPSFNVPGAYLPFCNDRNFKKAIACESNKVVCCEYNRAHIVKSYFGLKQLPYIVPNKLYTENYNIADNNSIELDLRGKKIILYQGIFNFPERKLDDYCETIKNMPEEYVLILMGDDSKYKKYLKAKYESDRIIFLPFYPTPHHLEVTKMAYIGILSYNTSASSIDSALNLLYCAPNKIFEYSSYGIPMISNDVPSLTQIFDKYNCGISLHTLALKNITEAIEHIELNYESYKKGARRFYESVDIKSIITNLADA